MLQVYSNCPLLQDEAVDETPKNRYNYSLNPKEYFMQKCELTGKGKQYGSNVSFSQRHTKKVWKPNLQTKTFVVDGRKVTMKVSTQALRTLKKKGLLTQ
jgi:large subunit ribosomal protein L28